MDNELRKNNKNKFESYFRLICIDLLTDCINLAYDNLDLSKGTMLIDKQIKNSDLEDILCQHTNSLWELYNENSEDNYIVNISMALFYGRYLHTNCFFSLAFHTCQRIIQTIIKEEKVFFNFDINKGIFLENIKTSIKNLLEKDESDFLYKKVGCTNTCREYLYVKEDKFIKTRLD